MARRIALLDEGGDHVCVATEPVAVRSTGRLTPLRLSDVQHLQPGQDPEERNDPPTERATAPPNMGSCSVTTRTSAMPSKFGQRESEKQYEAPKDKGISKTRAAKFPRRAEAWREAVGRGRRR